MGLAQTGTGKTAAFGLPIVQRLLNDRRSVRAPRALIIAPTRELCLQIEEAFTIFAKGTPLRSIAVFGGVGIEGQIQKLRQGRDVVVACPGRLLDHMDRGTIDLSQLQVLVLDEADRMFDMGFLPTIRKIVKRIPRKRQTLLFSATMPDDISALARELLGEPVRVQVGTTAPVHTVAHAIYPVEQGLKTGLLFKVLTEIDSGSVLVFTRTKHRAKRLAQDLAKKGHQATALHGNLSQGRRQAALDGFRKGAFQILVATDIAARGIDVSGISHVINYDMPDTPEAYTHRIGRTGRASRNGDAFTFVTAEDTAMVRAVEQLLKSKLQAIAVEGFTTKHLATPRASANPAPKRSTPTIGQRGAARSRSRHARNGMSRGV